MPGIGPSRRGPRRVGPPGGAVGGGRPPHGPAFPAVFIRAPWVESVSDQVDVLARIDRGGVDTIVAVRQGALLATSFHPELTGDHRIHEMFLSIVRQVS